MSGKKGKELFHNLLRKVGMKGTYVDNEGGFYLPLFDGGDKTPVFSLPLCRAG